MTKTKYDDLRMERSFLRAMLSDDKVTKETSEDTTFGYRAFNDKVNQNIYKAIVRHHRKYSALPTADVLKRIVMRYVEKSSLYSRGQQAEKYGLIIEKLLSRESTNKELANLPEIRNQLLTYAKGRDLRMAIMKSADMLDDGDIDGASNVFYNFKSDMMSAADLSDEGDYISDWTERWKLVKKKEKHPELFKAIPTGIYGWNPYDPFKDSNTIDFDVFLDGGHYDGELEIVVGDSGGGKSNTLLEFAHNAAIAGKNVMLFTIEMSRWKMQTRLDSRITGIPFRKFRTATLTEKDWERWERKMKAWKEKVGKGSIYVVGFPQQCTVATIEAKIKERQQQSGNKVDLVVVDYLNDIKPNGRYETDKDWKAQGEISWDLKQMAGLFKIPVVTANQGKSSSILSKFKVSESGVPKFRRMMWNDAAFSPLPSHHSTTIIGLLLSKKVDNGIWDILNSQVIKHRDGETTLGVVSVPDLSRCRICTTYAYAKAKERLEEGSVENFEGLTNDGK